MQALIAEGTYRQLQLLAKRWDNAATVGMPVGPVRGNDCRILFVGQAARLARWDESFSFAQIEEEAAEHVRRRLLDAGRSWFWRGVAGICELVEHSIGTGAERAAMVGWSNLAKIAISEERPKGPLLKAQASLCIECLQEEIRAMMPTATVFLISDYGRKEILFPAFGDKWTQQSPTLGHVPAMMQHPDYGLLLWASHPLGKDGRRMAHERRYIADTLANALKAEIRLRKST